MKQMILFAGSLTINICALKEKILVNYLRPELVRPLVSLSDVWINRKIPNPALAEFSLRKSH